MIDASTSLYAVLGNPVAHSLSPVMHNAAFAHTGINAVYLAFKVTDLQSAISGIKSMGIQGVSITIPHKVEVMKYLDAIDPVAKEIGAVNTIINQKGFLNGYNTDGIGAVQALKEHIDLKNQSVAILGAGGAARAIGFSVVKHGATVTIFNRTPSKGEQLAKDLNADYYPLSDFHKKACKILINTTPVGMIPNIDCSPIPKHYLEKDMTVMDIVYHPLKTKLLQDAEALGCKTIDGVSMFVYQGAFQFELWTGISAPIDIMKQAVLSCLA